MEKAKPIGGFNTTLQSVDDRYFWINDMIRQRQQLVLLYMQIIDNQAHAEEEAKGGDPFDYGTELEELVDTSYKPALVKQVSQFCVNLTDYISHGHFDLYPKLVELIENASGRSLSIAQKAMPRINETTEPLLNFCDKYAEVENVNALKDLRNDLAAIGEEMEIRFRMEDRLIIALRLVHTIVSSANSSIKFTPDLSK